MSQLPDDLRSQLREALRENLTRALEDELAIATFSWRTSMDAAEMRVVEREVFPTLIQRVVAKALASLEEPETQVVVRWL